MKIHHLAIWTTHLEELKDFYVSYFAGTAGPKYVNPAKGFESYFVHFETVSLEIMRRKDITERSPQELLGPCHLAFELPGKAAVDELTERLRQDGFTIAGEPRTTGDGMYESVVLDPDSNRIELVFH